MDFDLSADERTLADAAAELLDDFASPRRVRAVVDGSQGWDRELWAAMVDQGWAGVSAAPSVGGLGMGAVEVAVLAEQIGRYAAPAPFLSTTLAVEALVDGGAPEITAPILAGERLACVAWSRDPRAVTAKRDGSGWILSGRTDPTLYAPSASVAVVVAWDGSTSVLCAVDLDELGRPPAEPAMDRTRELGWLTFERAPARRLDGGELAARTLVDRGAAYTCAEMLGGAGRVLDMSVQYATDRVQFGRPIGSFQAVKHRCADMLVDVEGMRSTAYWAAWCLSAGDADSSVAASTAKIWGADASTRVMASGLQVHGGIGFTWEHDLHLFFKRAQLDRLTFGDATFHRDRLAALLRARVEAGESVL